MESSTRHNFTRGILSFVLFFCVLCSIRVLLAMHTYKGISSETPCSWRGIVLSQPSLTGKAVRLDVLVVYVGEKRVSRIIPQLHFRRYLAYKKRLGYSLCFSLPGLIFFQGKAFIPSLSDVARL